MKNRLDKNNIEQIYKASPMQAGMLFHSLIEGSSFTYFRQLCYRIHGSVIPTLVEETFNVLLKRHDILRTVFNYKNTDEILQIVMREWFVDFRFEDIRAITDESSKEVFIEKYKENDKERDFDLSRDTLIRIAVIQLTDSSFEFIWSYHHILMDGWCISILTQEYIKIYACLLEKRPPILPSITQYSAYINWRNQLDKTVSQAYWENYLAGFTLASGLPKQNNPTGQAIGFEKEPFLLSEEDSKQLIQISKNCKATLSSTIQAIWGILLAKYNGTRDVVFGLVVAGRPTTIKGIESMVGLFINTVPVRIQYEATTRFSDLIKKSQEGSFEREEHEYSPLAEIQAGSALGESLFDHILSFENFPIGDQIKTIIEGGDTENQETDTYISASDYFALTNYPLNLSIIPSAKIQISLDYNPQVYELEIIRRAVSHLEYLIKQILSNPEVLIENLSIVPPKEHALLQAFSTSYTQSYPFKTVVEAFESQANQTPEAPAIFFQDRQLSYSEVQDLSLKIACILKNTYAISKGDFVGLMLPRSEWIAIYMLAIWKAGAVYVPIDESLPKERIRYILDQVSAKLLITTPKNRIDVSVFSNTSIVTPQLIMQEWEKSILHLETDIHVPSSKDIAYVIFTSGSTGRPKGVLIRHGSLADRILYHIEHLAVSSTDRILQFATISFDASLVEMLMPILSGGSLAIVDDEAKYNLELLLTTIERLNVGMAIFPPAFLKVLNRHPLPTISKIISTGEAASLEESLFYAKTKAFYNGYGPTESCIGATFYKVDFNQAEAYRQQKNIPIGRPFANTRVYVLDQEGLQKAIGHVGEICISGPGLAIGYLNDEEMSSQKFVLNKYSESQDEKRIYKTGDLGRWTMKGELEYVGRMDKQVQIRGIRVEPYEIERVLMTHENIQKAIVKVVEITQNPVLIAYITCEGEVSEESLKEYTYQHLPSYMIPTKIITIDHFPINRNGKIDTTKLAIPALDGHISSWEVPKGKNEEQLAAIWQKVLQKKRISRNANFFELGGHSLKATQLISRIYREFGIKLKLGDTFKYPVLSELTQLIQRTAKTQYEEIQPAPPQKHYSLSHAQYRLWLAHQFEEGQLAYNMPANYKLEGPLDIESLQQAFQLLVERHEILRTNFVSVEGGPRQVIRESALSPFRLEYFDLRSMSSQDKTVQSLSDEITTQPFNLENDSLMRARLIHIEEAKFIFSLVLHHIICDAWSIEVFTRDIFSLYNALVKGEPHSLPAMQIQYKDYSVWQQKYAFDPKHASYWGAKLGSGLTRLKLPLDFPRHNSRSYKGAKMDRIIKKEIADPLRKLAVDHGASLFMMILSGVKALLHRYTGQSDIVIGTTVAGRDHESLENQIGFFVNTLVLRTDIRGSDSFQELLEKVKTTTLDAYQHQMYPFDKLATELEYERDWSRGFLFDVLVEFINTGDTGQIAPDFHKVTIEQVELDQHKSKHDLAFRIFDMGEEIFLNLKYNPDLFKSDTISIILDRLTQILQHFINLPSIPISEVDLSDNKILPLTQEVELGESFNFNF